MKRVSSLSLVSALLVTGSVLAGCGGEPPPEPVAPTAPSAAPVEPAAVAPVEAPKPAEPSPEEKKKAEEAKAMAEFKAETEAMKKAETARLTPEVHAQAKTIAEKNYASGKAAIQAAIAGKYRKTGDADRDKYRHPVETLELFGFKPNMTVLEFGPGEGWYTELLAPALAKSGKLVVTSGNPSASPETWGSLNAQRMKALFDTAPEVYGKVDTLVIDGKEPKLGVENKFDLIIATRELHGMEQRGQVAAWLAEFHKALKPAGILGIEQHRAPADAKPEESAKKGYLPQKWVIEQAEAAGFKLADKSEVNANPKDTKDYAEGVWTLPPSYALKDKDKAKYSAIGESDRMTLKFVKVATKAPAADKKAADKKM